MTRSEVLEAAPQTMWQRLEEITDTFPDKRALLFVDVEQRETAMSYRELLEESLALSAGLVALGVEPHDRVAIVITSRVEWVVSSYAVNRAGDRVRAAALRFESRPPARSLPQP